MRDLDEVSEEVLLGAGAPVTGLGASERTVLTFWGACRAQLGVPIDSTLEIAGCGKCVAQGVRLTREQAVQFADGILGVIEEEDS